MKYRESGMPVQQQWNTFFQPLEVLHRMEINGQIRNLVDIGCGYGTFLLPAARLVSAKVFGIDVDPKMIEICKSKIARDNLDNVALIHGDVAFPDTIQALGNSQTEIDYVSLFNILHCEEPVALLKRVYDLLHARSKVGVIHWKYEETPRGPSMEIRPKPEMVIDWADQAGLTLKAQVELPPYHYGLIFVKK